MLGKEERKSKTTLKQLVCWEEKGRGEKPAAGSEWMLQKQLLNFGGCSWDHREINE